MQAAKLIRDRHWRRGLATQSALRPWLQEAGSLTARLKRHYADFAVQPVEEGWRTANVDELALLGQRAGQWAWVRDVWLQGAGEGQVFAHSVMCRTVLRGRWHGLRHIGRRPLGAALFADTRVRRGRLHFKRIGRAHPLFRRILASMPELTASQLWARRSVFTLEQSAILVTEVFLPGIIPASTHIPLFVQDRP